MSKKARFIAVSIINTVIFALLFVVSFLAIKQYVPLDTSYTQIGMLSVIAHTSLFFIYDLWEDTQRLVLKLLKIPLIVITVILFLFSAFVTVMHLTTINNELNVFILPFEILWPIAIMISFFIYRDKTNNLLSILALPISIAISYVCCIPLCYMPKFIPWEILRMILSIVYFILLAALQNGSLGEFIDDMFDAIFYHPTGNTGSDVIIDSDHDDNDVIIESDNDNNEEEYKEDLHNDSKVHEEIIYEVRKWSLIIFSGKSLNIYRYSNARVKVEWIRSPYIRDSYGTIYVENGIIKITLLEMCYYATDLLQSQIISSISDEITKIIQNAIDSCKYYSSYKYSVNVDISFEVEYDY